MLKQLLNVITKNWIKFQRTFTHVSMLSAVCSTRDSSASVRRPFISSTLDVWLPCFSMLPIDLLYAVHVTPIFCPLMVCTQDM